MLFPTFAFALFFLPTFLVSWTLHSRHQANKIFLLAASYVFYAAWDWRFCGLLAASSAGNWYLGRKLASRPKRTSLLAVGIGANLFLLGYFKYAGFFCASMNDLLVGAGLQPILPFVETVLPVGISFVIFHGISYLVDVRRRDIPPANLIDVMLYVGFFPHLVAGPIVRARFFLPQLVVPTSRDIHFAAAMALIVSGLFKKVIVATMLGTVLVDPAFLDPGRQSASGLWLAMYAYAIQIFCDFSAYTDIATGVAALFGYRFPLNFKQPYRSVSLRDFWGRWHVSLSHWLRDYLYIPLGGSRGTVARTCFNLVATMVLGGLWHGAAWTFVAWGLLHGLGQVAGRLCPWTPPRWLGWFITMHVVCAGWVLFRSPNLPAAADYFRGMFSWSDNPFPDRLGCVAALVVAAAIACHFLPTDLTARISVRLSRLPPGVQAAAAAVAIATLAALGPDGVPAFIYFAF